MKKFSVALTLVLVFALVTVGLFAGGHKKKMKSDIVDSVILPK